MQVLKKFLYSLLAATIAICAIVVGMLYNFAYSPNHDSETPVIVEINSGMTLRQISDQLKTKSLISNQSTFLLYTYLQGKQNQIQAGEYELSPSMPPRDILESITNGRTILYPVTIPEGYRITEIADLLAREGLVNREKFIAATRNPKLIALFNVGTNNLEGYLYPETYKFSRHTDEKRIVRTMVETFKARAYTEEIQAKAKALNMTFHNIITLASLIEKETGLAMERELISSVFHNRLRKGMRLQTDPTVIYAMANFDGNIRKKDLSIDSPYNTYKYRGLPPGPIASPGIDSIHAALNPAETENIFFVSKQDGSHQFSITLDDHNRAVRKYQLRRRSKVPRQVKG